MALSCTHMIIMTYFFTGTFFYSYIIFTRTFFHWYPIISVPKAANHGLSEKQQDFLVGLDWVEAIKIELGHDKTTRTNKSQRFISCNHYEMKKEKVLCAATGFFKHLRQSETISCPHGPN